MVNANIDLTADQLIYDINDTFYTNFLAGTFTGPAFENITPGGPEFYWAQINPADNSLGLEATDVFVTNQKLYVNVQGITFDNGDGFTLNLGFLFRGNDQANTITGVGYNDRLVGFGGNDLLSGGRGLDRLVGGNGNDHIDGGGGGDLMVGGNGNDWFTSDNLNDRIVEAAGGGVDTIFSNISRTTAANVENLTLTGTALFGIGNTLANVLQGNDMDNQLSGGAGADWLYGGNGGDTLTGGAGIDHLVGEGGSDTFVFTVAAGRDFVHAYEAGVDRLDLSQIDADTATAGDQAFTYIAAAAFTSVAGQLQYAAGVLSGDVNGDGQADFQVLIANHPALTGVDLIL
jgi:Ca2+-binding RTX toxin-like protein